MFEQEISAAINEGNLEKIIELIDKGADPNTKDTNDGITPLQLAADMGSFDIVKALLERGAKVDIANTDGKTPLHLAAKSGSFDIVSVLLENGANVNAKDNTDITPLHLSFKDPRIINLFIEQGANLEAADQSGNTPLHFAAKFLGPEGVKTLIAKGANVYARNQNGKTPLDIASERKAISDFQIGKINHIVELLKQKQASDVTAKSSSIDATKKIIAESAPQSVTSKRREVKYCELVVKNFSEWLDEIRYNKIPTEQAISNVEDLFIQFPGGSYLAEKEPNLHLNRLPKKHQDRLFDAVLASGNFQLAEALTRIMQRAYYIVPNEIQNLRYIMSKKEERAGKLLLPHFRRQQKEREREAREKVDAQTTPEDTLRCNPQGTLK